MHQPREHTARPHPLWEPIRAFLEAGKRQVYAQIESTPTPITGCDAQFDHLIEQRNGFSRELARLEMACAESLGEGSLEEAIAAFLASSPLIDPESARTLKGARG